MNKTVLVPVCDGVEDIETITLVDVLRRAGAQVFTAALGETPEITTAHGVRLIADGLLDEWLDEDFDLIVLPGGTRAAETFRDCRPLIERMLWQKQQGLLYGAICASPAIALAPNGLLTDKMACCYPTLFGELPNPGISDLRVVIDGNCITSQAPGTAMAFALALVAELFDMETRNTVAEALVA